MKIFLLGNQGYMSLILQQLIDENVNVVGICTKFARKGRLSSLIKQLKDWCKDYFEIGQDNFNFKSPFEDFPEPANIAKKYGIPILPSKDIRKDDFLQDIQQLAPDVILCAGFHRLIPRQVTQAAKVVSLNFHPSFLPKHRGGTPNRWVVKLGENFTGISVHQLAEGFDTGDILQKTKIKIQRNEVTWGDVETKISAMMPEIASAVIASIRDQGELKYLPQVENDASEEPSLKQKDCEIDWSQSSEQILRTCLCMQPKSAGISNIKGKKVCIWGVTTVVDSAISQAPGQILKFEENGDIIVSCGTGHLRISAFLSFSKIVPAPTMVKKYRLQRGDIFI